MKKSILTLALACAAGTLTAAPKIENVKLNRNPTTRLVTITYELSEDAIVTPKVFTNEAQMAWSVTDTMAGDVHRLVKKGTGTIYWKPVNDETDALVADGTAKVELSAWAKDNPPDYMILDTLAKDHKRFYVCEAAVPGGIGSRLYKTQKLAMRKIYAKDIKWPMATGFSHVNGGGTFQMRQHYVTLTTNYYINVYEVTQGQFVNAIGKPSVHMVGDSLPDADVRPANNFSYFTLRGKSTSYIWPQHRHKVVSTSYINLFRKRFGLDELDLPTEAQWEYACRGGEAGNMYTGEELTEENLSKVAWHSGNNADDPNNAFEGNGTNVLHEVGLKQPNKWGLYDMMGNGWEICLDALNNGNTAALPYDYYMGEDSTDPVGIEEDIGRDTRRATRGGRLNAAYNSNLFGCGDRQNINPPASYYYNALRFVCPAVF